MFREIKVYERIYCYFLITLGLVGGGLATYNAMRNIISEFQVNKFPFFVYSLFQKVPCVYTGSPRKYSSAWFLYSPSYLYKLIRFKLFFLCLAVIEGLHVLCKKSVKRLKNVVQVSCFLRIHSIKIYFYFRLHPAIFPQIHAVHK